MTGSIHCTSRVGSLASGSGAEILFRPDAGRRFRRRCWWTGRWTEASSARAGPVRRLPHGIGRGSRSSWVALRNGRGRVAPYGCSLLPALAAPVAFQLEGQGGGRAGIHALPRGPLQGRRQGVVQRGGNPDVEPATHEGQPQRFAGLLRHAQAVSAANALAGLVDDQGMIGADFDLSPRRGVAVAPSPEFLGGLAQAAGVGLAAIATAASTGLADGFLAGQGPRLAQPPSPPAPLPEERGAARGVGSATAMNCRISSGRRHLTWLEKGWTWRTKGAPDRNWSR